MSEVNFKEKTMWTRDNLPIMRGMNDECIDLIYLDPPFNSNVLYQGLPGEKNITAAFTDVWKLTKEDEIWHESIKKEHRCLYEVIEASKYAHSESMMSYLIVMTERLFEMHRILKSTGSIYLHCDPTASHYLKIIMDCVFGNKNIINEIIWCYKGPANTKNSFKKKHDTIFFYKKSDNFIFNADAVRISYDEKTIERRKYKEVGKSGGSGIPVKGMSESEVQKGMVPNDWWSDIFSGGQMPKKERTGYPTQKPLKLLERIISASTNEGDLVLDPFCGCATALVAAEKLNRKWVGVDISYIANQLVKLRMRNETNLFDNYDVIERTDIPKRTDVKEDILKDIDIKQKKYEEQEGRCAGCKYPLPQRYLTKDRIVPGAKGGQYTEENTQLLCQPCNSTKGKNDMPFLTKRLQEQELIYKEDKG